MPETVILSYARTPIGRLGGGLSTVKATELGGIAIKGALERAEVEPERIDHVVMGNVIQAGLGFIPSRQAADAAGIPKEISSETINKVCASGMRALGIIDAQVRAGDVGVAVAGGMESMSGAPYLLPGARFGFRMGDVKALDAMTHDGLTNPWTGKQMAPEASEVAQELEMTRADLDRFAESSHRKWMAAVDEGRLPEEIISVTVKGRKGETRVELDESPRRDISLEKLAKLPPIGSPDGTHTAGNSPGVNDGGAALIVASSDWAEKHGKEPLARVISQAQVANEYHRLATTPGAAALKALEMAGLTPDDVDLWEINEAFSSVALNSVRTVGADMDRVNVNGGAVAIGHPLGCSGARIVGTLVSELRRRGGGTGVAAICSGGGQGDAMVLEVFGG